MKTTLEDLKRELKSGGSFDEILMMVKYLGIEPEEDGTVDIPDELFSPEDLQMHNMAKSINFLIKKVNQHSELFKSTGEIVKTLDNSIDELAKANQEALQRTISAIGFFINIVCEANGLDPVNDPIMFFKRLSFERLAVYCEAYPLFMNTVSTDKNDDSKLNFNEKYDEELSPTLNKILQFYCRVVTNNEDEVLQKELLTSAHDELMIMSTFARNTDILQLKEAQYLVKLFILLKEHHEDIFNQYLSEAEYEKLIDTMQRLYDDVS